MYSFCEYLGITLLSVYMCSVNGESINFDEQNNYKIKGCPKDLWSLPKLKTGTSYDNVTYTLSPSCCCKINLDGFSSVSNSLVITDGGYITQSREFTISSSQLFNLRRLHMNNIHLITNKQSLNFLSSFKHLETLQLTGPHICQYGLDTFSYTWYGITALLNDITSALEGITTLEILIIDTFQGYCLQGNGMLNISQFLFPLRNTSLKYLTLKNLGINIISPGLYDLAPNLVSIDLSENNLKSVDNLPFLLELWLHPNLKYFKYQAFNQDINSDGLYKSHSLHSSKISKRETIKDIMDLITDCMQILNIASSIDVLHNYDISCKVVQCVTSKTVLSGIPCGVINIPRRMKENSLKHNIQCVNNFETFVGENLREITIDNFSFYLDKTSPTQYIYPKNYCFTKNKITKIHIGNSHDFLRLTDATLIVNQVSFVGFEGVKVLDVPYNSLSIINITFSLKSFPNIQYFGLRGNKVNLSTSTNGICSYSPMLRALDVSLNGISEVNYHTFNTCTNLISLSLAENNIRELIFMLQSPVIQMLNFSYNPIMNISSQLRQTLSTHARNLRRTQNKVLQIDLSNVLFYCSCPNIELLDWIIIENRLGNINFNGFDNYECLYNERIIYLTTLSLKKFSRDCSHINMIIGITCGNFIFITTIFLVFLSYKYRYRIYTKYVMFLRRILRNKRKENDIECDFDSLDNSDELFGYTDDVLVDIEYDAYVGYCTEDRFWVHGPLLSELERKYGFHVCIHYRDFPVGEHISDTIIKYMTKSEHIILILSSNAIKNEWFQFEVEMANLQKMKKGKKIIMLKLGQLTRGMIDQNDLPLLLAMYDSGMYIQLPERYVFEPDEPTEYPKPNEKEEMFWAKVAKQMYGENLCLNMCSCLTCKCKNTGVCIDDNIIISSGDSVTYM